MFVDACCSRLEMECCKAAFGNVNCSKLPSFAEILAAFFFAVFLDLWQSSTQLCCIKSVALSLVMIRVASWGSFRFKVVLVMHFVDKWSTAHHVGKETRIAEVMKAFSSRCMHEINFWICTLTPRAYLCFTMAQTIEKSIKVIPQSFFSFSI